MQILLNDLQEVKLALINQSIPRYIKFVLKEDMKRVLTSGEAAIFNNKLGFDDFVCIIIIVVVVNATYQVVGCYQNSLSVERWAWSQRLEGKLIRGRCLVVLNDQLHILWSFKRPIPDRRYLFLTFRCSWQLTIFNINFTDNWIWTADLWCQKWPLSHNHYPKFSIHVV